MKVLFCAAPAYSRFANLFSLANAMKAMNIDIKFITPPSLSKVIESMGFSTLVVAPELTELQHFASDTHSLNCCLKHDKIALKMFAYANPVLFGPKLIENVDRWSPDLIVFEEGEYTSALVSKVKAIPSICVGWSAPQRPLKILDRVAIELSKAALEIGVDLSIGAEDLYGSLRINRFPKSMELYESIFPNQIIMQPCLPGEFDVTYSRPLQRNPQKVIHASFGTIPGFNANLGLMKTVIEAFNKSPADSLLLSTGDNVTSSQLRKISTYKKIELKPFFPHDVILSSCNAIICHGGASTVAAALSHACPLIIVPQGGASQLRNSMAVVRRGLGVSILHGTLDTDSLASAIRIVLEDSFYLNSSRSVLEEVKSMPSPLSVAKYIIDHFS